MSAAPGAAVPSGAGGTASSGPAAATPPSTTPRGAAALVGSASDRPARPATATTAPGPARPVSPAHRPAHTVAPLDPEIADRLREAEDAYRNHLAPLRQLAAADTVLRTDPGNLRARFLAGDALIRSGDIDNGCKYLAMAKPLVIARTRARAAGCPD